MARVDMTGFEEVQNELLRQSELARKAIPEMLKAGGEVYRAEYERQAKKLNKTGRGTGDLAKSIKVSAVKGSDDSMYVDVAPTGKDRHGVRNAEKGFVLNYGRSNMPANPWFDTATNLAESEAKEAMKRVWGEYSNG